ncbi:TetR/AcrR family transcriptional regulator [Hyphomicrobium sp.]|jgi:AcrR family transcriptional regulator|uniref:TetR/AcrR family transcriptional regulator n=1 Tax=Hyphomicrobium sp. TaxID=82 RepID=UPI003565707B
MTRDKSRIEQPKQTTRERVLDAAERLLMQGSAAFSMRELAEEARMSFATPFNQFGSKAAIMLALSARRIDTMRDQLVRATLPESAVGRVLMAVDIAAAVMLSAPAMNRSVMGAISAPSDEPGNVFSRSSAFWAEALGAGDGLASATRSMAMAALPDQLAVAFRGVLSFWTAGELSDQLLRQRARAAAAAVLLGFIGRDGRAELLVLLEAASGLKSSS